MSSVLQKPEVVRSIADALGNLGIFATKRELDVAFADLQKRAFSRTATGENDFSITRFVRGLAAQQGKVIAGNTRESDVSYATKALATGTTPGSYLVPIIQANEVIAILSELSVLRRMGPRIWPMAGIASLRIPQATATPTAEWLGQNTAQTASDPNLGQVTLDLKTMRALVAIPNELLAVSTPAVDAVVTELLAIACAERESIDFLATTAAANAPTNTLYSVSGTGSVDSSNSANGGAVAYADLVSVLDKAYTAKAVPPFCWLFHPHAFFSGVHGMLDLSSRPIVREGIAIGVQGIQYSLFGFPVYVSANFPVNQTYGSGSNKTYGAFLNPNYVHLGEDPNLQIMVSTERYFDANQTAIRAVRRMDWAFAPAAGIILLKGIS